MRNHRFFRFAIAMMVFLLLPNLVSAAESVSDTAAYDQAVFLLIVYVVVALGFSFLCSIAEAVLLSITPSYIESLKSRSPHRAALLKRLKQDNIEQSLAAILTLNTIAHTVGAIGSGAQATIVFGSAWFGVFSAVMTLLILFLSEIVPKTIGAVFWMRLAGPTAVFVRLLIFVLYPVVWISEALTKAISGSHTRQEFSREELAAMTRIGKRSGEIHDQESRIIWNMLRFGSLTVDHIMTPRTVIFALPDSMTIGEAVPLITDAPFSRIPIYHADLDDVAGFVLKDEILISHTQGEDDTPLKNMQRKIITTPESASLLRVWERLLSERHHIAIVVDEYGGTQGLVTLEDLVETIIGMEIVDETDTVEDMQALARKKWSERIKALGIRVEQSPKSPLDADRED